MNSRVDWSFDPTWEPKIVIFSSKSLFPFFELPTFNPPIILTQSQIEDLAKFIGPGFLITILFLLISADESESGVGLCGWALTAISWALVMVTLPFSLCVCFKVRNLKHQYTRVFYKHYFYKHQPSKSRKFKHFLSICWGWPKSNLCIE